MNSVLYSINPKINLNASFNVKIVTTHDLLIDHVETIHVIKESMHRDHIFPQKCPNCPGWIYSDDENKDHYDDFEEYGQCGYRKVQQ